MKGEVEAKKITDEESSEEIEKWVSGIDEELSKADIEVKQLQEWQNAVSRVDKQRQREEQLQLERELYEAN